MGYRGRGSKVLPFQIVALSKEIPYFHARINSMTLSGPSSEPLFTFRTVVSHADFPSWHQIVNTNNTRTEQLLVYVDLCIFPTTMKRGFSLAQTTIWTFSAMKMSYWISSSCLWFTSMKVLWNRLKRKQLTHGLSLLITRGAASLTQAYCWTQRKYFLPMGVKVLNQVVTILK